MADRCLIWHIPDIPYPSSLPVYYLDADYAKAAVRIYADTAPFSGDLKVDIQADGVSIFNDHSSQHAWVVKAGVAEPAPLTAPDTSVSLTEGENQEEDAADFVSGDLDEGTWLKLVVVELAGAGNVTVQLELNKLSEQGESSEE